MVRDVCRGVGIGEVLPVNEEVIEVGEEDEVLDAEDVEPMRVLPTPIVPSYAETEKHRIDHWPPRTWCDECCEGFGRERAHFKKPEGEPRKAIVSFDYMFLKKRTVILEIATWTSMTVESRYWLYTILRAEVCLLTWCPGRGSIQRDMRLI